MEVSDDEDTQGQVEKKKTQIEMNVKIPQMMPRSIQKTRQSSPSLVGPKRVGGATSYVTKKSTKPIAINISKKAIETVVNHIVSFKVVFMPYCNNFLSLILNQTI